MLCRVGLGIVFSVFVALPVSLGITLNFAATATTSYNASLMAGHIRNSESGVAHLPSAKPDHQQSGQWPVIQTM
jgi:hypothetical protein